MLALRCALLAALLAARGAVLAPGGCPEPGKSRARLGGGGGRREKGDGAPLRWPRRSPRAPHRVLPAEPAAARCRKPPEPPACAPPGRTEGRGPGGVGSPARAARVGASGARSSGARGSPPPGPGPRRAGPPPHSLGLGLRQPRAPASRVPRAGNFTRVGSRSAWGRRGLGSLQRRGGRGRGQRALLPLLTVISPWQPGPPAGPGSVPSRVSRLSSSPARPLLLRRLILGSEGFCGEQPEGFWEQLAPVLGEHPQLDLSL